MPFRKGQQRAFSKLLACCFFGRFDGLCLFFKEIRKVQNSASSVFWVVSLFYCRSMEVFFFFFLSAGPWRLKERKFLRKRKKKREREKFS